MGRTVCVSWKHSKGPSYLHILGVIGLRRPVWNEPHATLPVAKLLTEGSVLGLGVPAAVGVMESHIEEEGPGCGEEVSVGVGSRPGRCLDPKRASF